MANDPTTEPSDRDATAEEPVELTAIARMAGVQTVRVRRYMEFGLFEAEQTRVTTAASHRALSPDQCRTSGQSGAAAPRPQSQLRRCRARRRAARPHQRAGGAAAALIG